MSPSVPPDPATSTSTSTSTSAAAAAAAAKLGLAPDPAETAAIVRAVEAILHRLGAALNARDFSDDTWHALLAASFRLDTDDTRRWGFSRGWTREQMQKGVAEAANKFPDWNMKILQMDTSVDIPGQKATLVANTQSTLGGYSRRSVMTLECARLQDRWCARRMNVMNGLDMGAMEAGVPF